MDKPPIHVKIVSKGHSWDAAVVDVESGAIIANVTKIEWTYGAGQEFPTTVVTLCDVPVELEFNAPGYVWVRPELNEAER